MQLAHQVVNYEFFFLDDGSQEPNVQARQFKGNKGVIRHQASSFMTPLEISMYVLLATFCFAIAVFVVSCVVYASKFKPVAEVAVEGVRAAPVNSTNASMNRDNRKQRETTTNAHDWVWLGRSTIDHSNRNSAVNNNPNEIRITTNPLNMNYCDPDDCVTNSFSNPNHIELPSRTGEFGRLNQSKVVDSSTYCRSKGLSTRFANLPIASSNVDDDIKVW